MNQETNRKNEVLELQNMLRLISQADGNLPLVNPDGIFGPETEAAVIAFQREAGLPANGIVDFATWNAIFHAYMNASRMISLRPIQPFPSGSYEIHRAERSDIVFFIQLMLSALAVAIDDFDDIVPTGIYDEKTENAITEFQKKHGIPANGIVDRQTWDALARSYNHIFGNALYSD
jgi:peptidoglycan hydrolase-like protein with peptidoglycan-binding domain